MGVIARVIKYAASKFVTVTSETRKDFNVSTMLFTPAGDDSIPLPDERLVLMKVDGTGKYAAVGVLTPSQGAKPGEKILFARDIGRTVVGKLYLKNDGTVEIEAENKLTAIIKGDITFDSAGNLYAKGATVEITGDTEIVLKTIGSAMWCPNGVTNCFFTGAPHGGPAMGIQGLKGG
ncbi:MAG: hypothetical protein FWC64_07155 [Treponema sp.]|nr:hypothetical protein [Treponema sp.]